MTKHRPRFWIEKESAFLWHSGSTISLDAPQSHHAAHVLRLKKGEGVFLFHHLHGEWLGTVESVHSQCVEVVLDHLEKPPMTSPFLRLVYSPLKPKITAWLHEKATELGVTDFYPTLYQYTQTPRLDVAKEQVRMVQAVQQCGRQDIPRLHKLTPFKDLAATWTMQDFIYICHNDLEKISTRLNPRDSDKKTWIVIGPEGGFSEKDFAILEKAPLKKYWCLSPLTLRAETAALAAIAHVSTHAP